MAARREQSDQLVLKAASGAASAGAVGEEPPEEGEGDTGDRRFVQAWRWMGPWSQRRNLS